MSTGYYWSLTFLKFQSISLLLLFFLFPQELKKDFEIIKFCLVVLGFSSGASGPHAPLPLSTRGDPHDLLTYYLFI